MSDLIKFVEQENQESRTKFPDFNPGDTIVVAVEAGRHCARRDHHRVAAFDEDPEFPGNGNST